MGEIERVQKHGGNWWHDGDMNRPRFALIRVDRIAQNHPETVSWPQITQSCIVKPETSPA